MVNSSTPIVFAISLWNRFKSIRLLRIWSPIDFGVSGYEKGNGFGALRVSGNCSTQPCPCGYYSHPEKACVCRPEHITRYLSRISRPLLDRIDLHIEVGAVNFKELQVKCARCGRDDEKRPRTAEGYLLYDMSKSRFVIDKSCNRVDRIDRFRNEFRILLLNQVFPSLSKSRSGGLINSRSRPTVSLIWTPASSSAWRYAAAVWRFAMPASTRKAILR
ncbi:ATP-binding protein [bacterium]|nr:ATP-binding protein [candidate division CSSED10-310 bacterium]